MNEVAAKKRDEFQQAHLDRVSRSFAYGIRQLDRNLRLPVGLSYLICRLLDTVEDANWRDSLDQEKAFSNFDRFLKERPSKSEVESWTASFPGDVPEGEKRLMNDASEVFREFHDLPPQEKSAILDPVLSMSQGMKHFMSRKSREGKLKLQSMSDVNRYCFFVAGVVGETLTRLIRSSTASQLAENERASIQSLSLADATKFGLFLQKVNVLKDQKRDEAEGRFLVPSRAAVFSSALADAERAFAYLDAIPMRLRSYRLFCGWALLLGLASLPAIEKAWSSDKPAKLGRVDAMLLAAKIETNIDDPERLSKLFGKLLENARSGAPRMVAHVGRPQDSKELDELVSLYRGELGLSELLSIFG